MSPNDSCLKPTWKKIKEKVAKVDVISRTWFLLSCFHPPVDTNPLLSKSSVSWQHLNDLRCVSRTTDGRLPDVLLLVSFLLF